MPGPWQPGRSTQVSPLGGARSSVRYVRDQSLVPPTPRYSAVSEKATCTTVPGATAPNVSWRFPATSWRHTSVAAEPGVTVAGMPLAGRSPPRTYCVHAVLTPREGTTAAAPLPATPTASGTAARAKASAARTRDPAPRILLRRYHSGRCDQPRLPPLRGRRAVRGRARCTRRRERRSRVAAAEPRPGVVPG